MKLKIGIPKIDNNRVVAVYTIAILLSSVFLSSLIAIIQNPSSSFMPTLVYAHHDDNTIIKNKSLINEISDKVVSGDTSKAAIEQILQQIQTQITQRSGQEKATAALKQIQSLIELNPTGTLSQS
ncbi:MAG: hypothetical protein JO297_07015, partial [Nitrososphaeraceae archaeon]|nr:hypothetical protein [Nitrososphaeraceae archaeon]